MKLGRSHHLLAGFILISSALAARAQISFEDIYRTNLLSQTGNGVAGTAYNFSYLGLDLTSKAPNQYSTVRVFYPGVGSGQLAIPIRSETTE